MYCIYVCVFMLSIYLEVFPSHAYSCRGHNPPTSDLTQMTPELNHLTPDLNHLTPELNHLTPDLNHLTPDL